MDQKTMEKAADLILSWRDGKALLEDTINKIDTLLGTHSCSYSNKNKLTPLDSTTAIQAMMAFFDFNKVHKTMTALDWKWHRVNQSVAAVPTLQEIKTQAQQHLEYAMKHGGHVDCGGLNATYNKEKEVLSLQFIAVGFDYYLEDDD